MMLMPPVHESEVACRISTDRVKSIQREELTQHNALFFDFLLRESRGCSLFHPTACMNIGGDECRLFEIGRDFRDSRRNGRFSI